MPVNFIRMTKNNEIYNQPNNSKPDVTSPHETGKYPIPELQAAYEGGRSIAPELYDLLVSLRSAKNTYARICLQYRQQGVEVSKDMESEFMTDIKNCISYACYLASNKLEYDILKGGEQ